MREIGGSIAVSPEARAEFERRVIDPWLADHPLRDMTFVRESPMARFAEHASLQPPKPFHPLVLNERRIVLDEVSRQRALVMEAISVERERAVDAIVRAFAAERSELLRSFESQRLATLEWGTTERREAIADMHREAAGSIDALRGERAIVVGDLRHIVDVVLLRVAIFLVAAVVLAPLVAHAYARVWPRRWRDPPK